MNFPYVGSCVNRPMCQKELSLDTLRKRKKKGNNSVSDSKFSCGFKAEAHLCCDPQKRG